jgi:hypothetical protein
MSVHAPLPDHTVVSIPKAERFVAALSAHDPRRQYAPLFLESLRLTLKAQELAPGCLQREGFPTWECCDAHRALQAEATDFRAKLDAIGPLEGPADTPAHIQVGSAYWWRMLGFDYPSFPRVTLEDDGRDGHYISETVSIRLAADWIDSLRPEDPRHQLKELYLEFLRYQFQRQKQLASPEELAAAWTALVSRAAEVSGAMTPGRGDTWQHFEPLTADWWERHVLFWHDYSTVVVD